MLLRTLFGMHLQRSSKRNFYPSAYKKAKIQFKQDLLIQIKHLEELHKKTFSPIIYLFKNNNYYTKGKKVELMEVSQQKTNKPLHKKTTFWHCFLHFSRSYPVDSSKNWHHVKLTVLGIRIELYTFPSKSSSKFLSTFILHVTLLVMFFMVMFLFF